MHPLILPMPASGQTPTVPQPPVAADATLPARVLPAGLTFAAVLNVAQKPLTDSARAPETGPQPEEPAPDAAFAENADASDTPDAVDLPKPAPDENTPDAVSTEDAVGVLQAPTRKVGPDPQMPRDIARTLRPDMRAQDENTRPPAGDVPDKQITLQQAILPKKTSAALPTAQTPQNTSPARALLPTATALPSATRGAFQMQIETPQNTASNTAPIPLSSIPAPVAKPRDPQPKLAVKTPPASPIAVALHPKPAALASPSKPTEMPITQASKAADPTVPLPASPAPTATYRQTARIDPLPKKPPQQHTQTVAPVQTPTPADPPAGRQPQTTAPPQIPDNIPLRDKLTPAAPKADTKATITPPTRPSAEILPSLVSGQTAAVPPVTPTTGTTVPITLPSVEIASRIQSSPADRRTTEQPLVPPTPKGQKPPAAQRPNGQPTPVTWTAPPLSDPSLAERGDPSAPDLAPTRLHAEGTSSAPVLPATLARPDLPPHVMRQLAEIAPHASSRPVDFTLSPEELGRVRMSLSIAEANVTVTLLAERPETLDLLRRHIDLLGQEFRALGFENIAFAFEGGTANDTADNTGEAADQTDPSEPDTALDTPTIHLSSGADTGLDLRL